MRAPPGIASTRSFTVLRDHRAASLRAPQVDRVPPVHADSNQGCGIRKCATTVRTRITGTTKTTLRDIPPSQRFAGGRSSSPTMTVASSAKRMPALINDARTGNICGGHIAEKLAAQPQPGRTGCATQSTTKPRRTTQAATTGERVAPCVLMGMSPDYRSGTPVARRPRRRARRNGCHARQRSGVTALCCQRRVGGDRRRSHRALPKSFLRTRRT